MDKDIKAVIVIITLIACAFVLSIGIITIKDYKTEKLYITYGYEQVMVKGCSTYLWRKRR